MGFVLKWFIRIWLSLCVLLNVAWIAIYGMATPSFWAVTDYIQQMYSPFNVVTHALNALLLSPVLLAYFWQEKRNKAKYDR